MSPSYCLHMCRDHVHHNYYRITFLICIIYLYDLQHVIYNLINNNINSININTTIFTSFCSIGLFI